MRAFRLTDAAFAALAAGRPSPGTLDELRRAQLSRHLLQLRGILRAADGRPPPWYAELSATDPRAARAMLADPMTGLYAAAVGRAGGVSGPDRPSLAPASCRLLTAAHDGLRLQVRLEDTDPLRGLFGLTPADRLPAAAVEHWQRCLDEAWRLLVDRHRPAAVQLAAVLRVIVPVEPDPAAGGISATSADAFGAVAMSAPADGVALAVGLLHETQHSVLNAVRFLFDLVEPSTARGYSPWRDDPRPAFGVLHGAYAYQAVTRFWRTEWTTGTAESGGRPGPGGTPAIGGRLAAFEFARWRAAVVAAADELLDGAVLTAAGRRFTGALRDEVAAWSAEPVDPEVARLAAGANTDHRVRWRLRNLVVEPAVVASVAAAWRAGAAAPATPDPLVRAVDGRELEHSERLNRMHELLRGRAAGGGGVAGRRPGGGVRPGDDAYLAGDYGTALEAYREGLPAETAWSGLALVSPHAVLRARPELVRAVHRELGGADPLELISWLDRSCPAGRDRWKARR